MGRELTPERMKYHEIMDRFIKLLIPGQRVYDIGKSDLHLYKEPFKEFDYVTVDRDTRKCPDIKLDIEGLTEENVCDYIDKADAILCNGVVEQCDDPMRMIKSCHAILKNRGLALFGFVLLGYPQHTYDRFRFTASGASSALNRYGFEIKESYIVNRNNIPSYILAICQRRP